MDPQTKMCEIIFVFTLIKVGIWMNFQMPKEMKTSVNVYNIIPLISQEYNL